MPAVRHARGGGRLKRSSFHRAWALLALALYPHLSLGAVWWLDTALGWQ